MLRRLMLAQAMQGGGGGNFGEEITFYFDAFPFGDFHTLKALDGMTWKDWVDSEYNTLGCFLEESGDSTYVTFPPFLSIAYDGGYSVQTSELIIKDYTYYTM